MTRTEALNKIDDLREPLPVAEYNDLAEVVRYLWDGYSIEDAQSALDAAAYSLPIDVTRAVRAILNDATD